MNFSGQMYVTQDAIKSAIETTSTVNATDDLRLTQYAERASAMIAQFCGRVFLPFVQTRTYDVDTPPVHGARLELDADLLEVTTLTNGDSSTITSGQYRLITPNLYPKTAIELLPSSGQVWTYSTDWQGAISVAGVWGYHESYGQAWVDSGDTVGDNPLSSSATEITVTDADGYDTRYHTPRFQVGHIVKIESEYIRVVAVNTSTNKLTVKRAQLGTTAAAHAQATAIYTFAVMDNVQQACLSLAVWLYRSRTSEGDKIQFLDGTSVITNVAPSHIAQTLRAYARF